MLEQLAALDTRLFRYLNIELANPFFDTVMPIITNDWFLRILFAVLLVILLFANFKRFRLIALSALLLVGLSDVTSSRILKPLINRSRPCQTMTDIHLLVGCGAGKSMPSSHAVNSFAQAVFFAMLFSRWRWLIMIGAVLVAYSRIAVGVHYPADVIVGAAIGSLLAAIMVLVLTRIAPQTVVESLERRPTRVD
jgi:undecaprenyl-diphosphatase